ncbi:hypothetical protein CYMTET_11525 [Cymbomonas tetramitiformis]|uniref:Protein NO VEIN C-terminal domain-containing protein n=1 Tax=Cymbomonas tetramitiformis TaxID=36881 RepID=A0AAE0LDE0_9CHLO|nr:hypothetical protein CYMTET_11525 [Cymbomonas tetramitiformis]
MAALEATSAQDGTPRVLAPAPTEVTMQRDEDLVAIAYEALASAAEGVADGVDGRRDGAREYGVVERLVRAEEAVAARCGVLQFSAVRPEGFLRWASGHRPALAPALTKVRRRRPTRHCSRCRGKRAGPCTKCHVGSVPFDVSSEQKLLPRRSPVIATDVLRSLRLRDTSMPAQADQPRSSSTSPPGLPLEETPCSHQGWHEPVAGEMDPQLLRLLTSIRSQVRVAIGRDASSPEVARRLGRCAEVHLGATAVQALPAGWAAELPESAGYDEAAALAPELLPAVTYAAALLKPDPVPALAGGSRAASEPRSDRDAAAALRALQAVAWLGDLEEESGWCVVFAADLGPFPRFLREGAAKGKVFALSVPAGGGDGRVMGGARAERLLRVDPAASADSFLRAALQADPAAAAAQLVSLLVMARGVEQAPQGLLLAHAGAALAGMPAGSKPMDGMLHNPTVVVAADGSAEAAGSPEGFVLSTLLHSPAAVRPAVAGVWIPALAEALKRTAEGRGVGTGGTADGHDTWVARRLLECCSRAGERRMLHALGVEMHVAVWAEDLEAALRPPPGGPAGLEPGAAGDCRPHPLGAAWGLPDDPSGAGTANCGEKGGSAAISQSPAEGGVDTVAEAAGKIAERAEGVDSMCAVKSEVQGELGHGGEAGCKAVALGRSCAGSTTEAEESAQAVVAMIRREEFGLEESVDEAAQLSALTRQAWWQRIGRALERLAQELYSSDAHLVLELVQNADDNRYPSGMVPTLALHLEEGCLHVLNNERGFRDVDLRALCDIGRSTKAGTGVSSGGCIGQKGIGFKSVFRVTDAPEVHSAGFHVRFDLGTAAGLMGYILPKWIDQGREPHQLPPPAAVDSEDETGASGDKWRTHIKLPLKPGEGGQHARLAASLAGLHPSMLLFLRRLRRIRLFYDSAAEGGRGPASLLELRTSGGAPFPAPEAGSEGSLPEGQLQLWHGQRREHWLLVRRWERSTVAGAGGRHAGTRTALALAFPLSAAGAGGGQGAYATPCEQQAVFAYLPLRSYGLRFIVQADFVLPSSREEIDQDSAWNQWLLGRLPALFVEALLEFCKLGGGREGLGPHPSAVKLFFDFVPVEGEVVGRFAAVVRGLFAALQGTACLPVELKAGVTDTCPAQDPRISSWARPSEVLAVPAEGGVELARRARRAVPSAVLWERAGLQHLHHAVPVSPAVLRGLGVRQLTPQLLVSLLAGAGRQAGGVARCGGAPWVARCLALLEAGAQSELAQGGRPWHRDPALVSMLRDAPIVPLAGEPMKFAALTAGPIFFSGGATSGAHAELSSARRDEQAVVVATLRRAGVMHLVAPEVEAWQDPEEETPGEAEGGEVMMGKAPRWGRGSSEVELVAGEAGGIGGASSGGGECARALARLGVARLEAGGGALLAGAVLPLLRSDAALQLRPEEIVGCTRFAFAHWRAGGGEGGPGSAVTAKLREGAGCVLLTERHGARRVAGPVGDASRGGPLKMGGVRFSKRYGSGVALESMPAVEFPVLSEQYLGGDEGAAAEMAAAMRAFFGALGVCDLFRAERVTRAKVLKAESPWRAHTWDGEGSAGEHLVRDWECDELRRALIHIEALGAGASGPAGISAAAASGPALLRALEATWEGDEGGDSGWVGREGGMAEAMRASYCRVEALHTNRQSHQLRTTDSSIALDLQQRAWLPACGPGSALQLLRSPAEVRLRTAATEALLGDHGGYLIGQWQPDSNGAVAAALGLQVAVSAVDLLAWLREWVTSASSKGDAAGGSQASGRRASLAQMNRVYERLAELLGTPREPELRALFAAGSSAVYVPPPGRMRWARAVGGGSAGPGDERAAAGSFVSLRAARLCDPARLHLLAGEEEGDTKSGGEGGYAEAEVSGRGGSAWMATIQLAPLEALYGERSQALFQAISGGTLRVQPSREEYLEEALRLAQSHPVAEAGAAVEAVLLMWSQRMLPQGRQGMRAEEDPEGAVALTGDIGKIGREEEGVQAGGGKVEDEGESGEALRGWVAQRLRGAAIFPSLCGDWTSPATGLLVNDDPALASRLTAAGLTPALRFATAALAPGPAEGTPRGGGATALLSACGVQMLSQATQVEAVTYGSRFCEDLEQRIAALMPYLQRYLYHHRGGAHADAQAEEGVGTRLGRLRVAVAEELLVKYRVSPAVGARHVVCPGRVAVPCVLCGDVLHVHAPHARRLGASLLAELARVALSSDPTGVEALAGLLQVIALMQEAGATEADLELEVAGSRGIPQLPVSVAAWRPPSPPSPPPLPAPSIASTDASGSGAHPLPGGLAASVWPPPDPSRPSSGRHPASVWPPPDPSRPSSGRHPASVWPPPDPSRPSSGRHPASVWPPRHSTFPQKERSPTNGGVQGGPLRPGDAQARAEKEACKRHIVAADEWSGGTGGRLRGSLQTTPDDAPTDDMWQALQLPSRKASLGRGLPEGGVAEGGEGVLGKRKARPWQAEVAAEVASCAVSMLPVEAGAEAVREPLVGEPEEGEAQGEVDERNSRVGRWGERLVAAFLRRVYTGGARIGGLADEGGVEQGRVEWVNEEAESGLPYDIVVDTAEGGLHYVEVKASRYASKTMFEVSPNEWKCAQEHGDHFHVFRVFKAGTAEARISRLSDPMAVWSWGGAKLYLEV